jgi:pimeloyl-ACP methyl ester carboxylesterase
MVSDLAQLVHRIIGIKIPVDILSVSLAGLIAQGLAVLHPDKVKRLSFSV